MVPTSRRSFSTRGLTCPCNAPGEGAAAKSNMRKNAKELVAVVPDVDFSGGVRGKYAARFAAGTNLVVLSPDVAENFPDSAAVNDAPQKRGA